MRKCINCPWQGEDDEVYHEEDVRNKCPVCGNQTEVMADLPETKKEKLLGPDLDGDGDFDKDDARIAGKALAAAKKLKKRKR